MATTKATLLGHRSATSFSDLTLSGDLTVNGTTTTLDTAVQNVDKLEIGASSTDYGAKINQASTGNILQLQDNGTDVMVVKDGGNVGIGTNDPSSYDSAQDNLVIKGTGNEGLSIIAGGNSNSTIAFGSGTGVSGYQGMIAYLNGSGGNAMTFRTQAVERMRIDSSGNVGIGTSVTSASLNIHEPNSAPSIGAIAQSQLHLYNGTIVNDHSTLSFGYSNTGVTNTTAYISYVSTNQGAYGYGDLIFGTRSVNSDTAPTERMRIDSSGNVHVARTTTGWAGGGGFRSDGSLECVISGGPAIRAGRGSNTGTIIEFKYNNSVIGSVSTNGPSNTAFNTSSDYRLKENIYPLTDALDRLNQLKPSRFNFIADSDKTMDGFLAHEVSDYVPEAVTGKKDQVDEDGEIEPQGIDQSKLVPLIVASIQELSAKVTALENA